MSDRSSWTPESLAALSPDEVDRVAHALASEGEDAAMLLAGAAELATDRVVRKQLRRALHRLRAGGHAVPERRSGQRSVLRPLEVIEDLAFLGAIGPRGRRFGVLLHFPRGGARVYQVVASDEEGVLSVEVGSGKRAQARRFANDLRERAAARSTGEGEGTDEDRGGPVELSAVSVRALLRSYQAGKTPASGVDPLLLAELTDGPDALTPGEQARAELEGESLGDSEASELLEERSRGGQTIGWTLEGDALEAAAAALHEIESSPLVLSEVQKAQRVGELLEDHAERVLDAPTRERLASRLEESAALWLAGPERESAIAAVRVAARVRGEASPLQVPYLKDLLERSLESAAARLRESEQSEVIARP